MNDRGLGALAAALKAGGWEPGLNVCAACGHSGGRHDLGNWCLDCPRPDEWDHTAKSPTGAKVDAGWCYFASMTETEERTLGLAAILGERGVFLPEGLPHDCATSAALNNDLADDLYAAKAEIARLRKIEEAARALCRAFPESISWTTDPDGDCFICADIATDDPDHDEGCEAAILRAALKAEP